MRTASFYSYKGGAGRTLLVANTALFLASAGKHVILIDLDLEAPGLPNKLGLRSREEEGPITLGLLDYISGAREGRACEISQYLYPVPDLEPGSGRLRGSLRLLPAGPAPSARYAVALSQTDWYALFWGGAGAGGAGVFLDLKKQLAALEPQPHYILIDSRTGMADSSAISLNILPDIVVCLILHNDENLEGSRIALRGASAVAKASDRELRLLPILSRIPHSLQATGGDGALTEQVQAYLEEPASDTGYSLKGHLSPIQCFHSEPNLQILEQLLFRSDSVPLRTSALLRDYLLFFKMFDSEAWDQSNLADAFKLLPKSQATVCKWVFTGRFASGTDLDGASGGGLVKRIKSRAAPKNAKLNIVRSHFLPKAKAYHRFSRAVARQMCLHLNLGRGAIKVVAEREINYDLLGFQIAEGRFDFCEEAYFFTPLRSRLADLVQFGQLESFELVARHELFEEMFRQLASATTLEEALSMLIDGTLKRKLGLHAGVLGDTAATSASAPLLSKSIPARHIHDMKSHFRAARWLLDSKSTDQVHIGLFDHGVLQRMTAKRPDVAARLRGVRLSLGSPVPVGFLLPAEDGDWRKIVARSFADKLAEMRSSGWEMIREELKDVEVNMFTYSEMCQYLALELTLGEARKWYTDSGWNADEGNGNQS